MKKKKVSLLRSLTHSTNKKRKSSGKTGKNKKTGNTSSHNKDRYYEEDSYNDDREYEDGDREYDDDREYDENGDREYDDEREYDRGGLDYNDENHEYEDDNRGSDDSDDDYYFDDDDEQSVDDNHGRDDDRGYDRDARDYEEDDRDYDRDERDYEEDDRDYDRDDRDYEEDDRDYDRDDRDYDDEYRDEYDDDYDDFDYDKDKSRRKKSRGKESIPSKVISFFQNTNGIERAAMAAGVVVIAAGVSIGTLLFQAQVRAAQVDSFDEMGTQLDNISVIGESGLEAIAYAQAMKSAANASTECSSEEDGEINVALTLSSIKQDIKVKITDSSSGNLISGVPFKIKVEGPSGTKEYEDDDKDGIIYKKDISAGSYKITMEELDSSYSKYLIDTKTHTLTVKDTIEYKKVDVSDEIKTESQVNVAKEDTQVQNTTVESTKTDTVEWVESTKTEVGSDDSTTAYSQVDKSTITDPEKTSKVRGTMSGKVIMLSGTDNLDAQSEEGSTASTPSPEYSLSQTSVSVEETSSSSKITASVTNLDDTSVSWSSADSSIATVDGGVITGVKAGSTSVSATFSNGHSESVSVTVTAKPKAATYSVSASSVSISVGGSQTITASSQNLSDTSFSWSSADSSIATVDSNGKITGVKAGSTSCTVKFSDGHTESVSVTVSAVKHTISSVSVSASTIKKGASATLSAVTSPEGGTVTWTSGNTKIATVSGTTVTAVAAGTCTLTAKCDDSSKTLDVTVTESGAVTVSPATGILVAGKTLSLKATVSGLSASTVTWTSSDSSKASVDSSGRVTGVASGSVTITATSTVDTTAKATCEITVKSSTDVLKDNSGNTVYIKGSDGNYKEATYADYYTAKAFYIKTAGKKYKYTGWQTIDSVTYFFDKDGNPVTGTQTIQGIDYTFGSDGALAKSSGNLGIDVSKWNGSIDWAAVKNSGVSYVIIRCGYRGSSTGALIEDPKFKSNIQGAKAAGLKVGAYFFTQAVSDVEAVEEASMAASLCSGYGLSYPVFLDVEGSNGRGDAIDAATRTMVCKTFCATMANSGFSTGIYANKTWLTSKINTGSLTGYKIWLAQYAATPSYSATRYDMWQYSSKGKVSGISGNVDMNISYIG